MASILDYALLCKAVYDSDPQVSGWTRAAFRPTGSGLYDAFQGAAFSKGDELVFAFKGTDNKRDVAADLKLGVGMNTSHFDDASTFVGKTGYGKARVVTFCGHSLGGAIAQIVGNRLRQRFVTFNAPGIALMSKNIDQMAVATATGSVAVRIAGAVVSALRHPVQAAQDLGSIFYHVQGANFRWEKMWSGVSVCTSEKSLRYRIAVDRLTLSPSISSGRLSPS